MLDYYAPQNFKYQMSTRELKPDMGSAARCSCRMPPLPRALSEGASPPLGLIERVAWYRLDHACKLTGPDEVATTGRPLSD